MIARGSEPSWSIRRQPTWVPPDRSLHLIDVENLTEAPGRWTPRDLLNAANAYELAARVRKGDHLIVASNPALAIDVLAAFPAARLIFRSGHDGADKALIDSAEPDDVARRYFQVVIGSGDGRFTRLAQELGSRNVPVVVVARRSRLARELAHYAHRVIYLPTQHRSAEGSAA
jgi:hypothetical protein